MHHAALLLLHMPAKLLLRITRRKSHGVGIHVAMLFDAMFPCIRNGVCKQGHVLMPQQGSAVMQGAC